MYQIKTKQSSLRRFIVKWLLIVAALLSLMLGLNTTQVLVLTNNHLYDYMLKAQPRIPDERIVILAIDDASLQDIGRWPWSRDTHAQLLKNLQTYKPEAVLFDILFTEPSGHDDSLGKAFANFSRTMPIAAPILLSSYAGEPAQVTMPIANISQTARLGQIVNTPDIDGVVRQVYVGLPDSQGKKWPTLAATLVDPALVSQYDGSFRVRFNDKAAYQTIPYASVLRGEIPPDLLKGKYVLIGATAVGLGDQITTPTSGDSGSVAGVELHANVLDTFLNGTGISQVNNPWLTVLPVLILMALFLWFDERYYLLIFALLLISYVGLIFGLLWSAHIWLPPVMSMLAMLLAYLLWSWQRATVMLKYVNDELSSAERSTGRLSALVSRNQKASKLLPHTLEFKMQQIHQLYQFTGDGLTYLPTALVVIGGDGEILVANYNAQFILNITETNFLHLLERFNYQTQSIELDAKGQWLERLQGVELNNGKQVYQLHVTSVVLSDGDLTLSDNTVWLINFLDLSKERLAEQQRRELVGFLSHDLRTPQVSILSLLELQNNPKTRVPESAFFEKIAEKVHHTLDWAHDLVELSQAKTKTYQKHDINFAHLVDEVLAHIADVAQAKRIELVFSDDSRNIAEAIWLVGDGALLVRAMVNLLTNALRYSPSDTSINIVVSLKNTDVLLCQIIDQGVGMSREQIELLERGESVRSVGDTPDAAQSLGIGFLMARTVVKRHGGKLTIESVVNQGTTINIQLPF